LACERPMGANSEFGFEKLASGRPTDNKLGATEHCRLDVLITNVAEPIGVYSG